MPTFECPLCEARETLTFQPDACSACGGASMIDLDMVAKQDAEARTIADQNDAFRRNLTSGADQNAPRGKSVMAPAVASEAETFRRLAVQAIASFDAFTEDDDDSSHASGAVTVEGRKVVWRIELCDVNFEFLSPCPADPAVTRRELSIRFPDNQ